MVVIDVKLHNTTSEMLWDLKALIDLSDVPIEIKKYITVLDGKRNLPQVMGIIALMFKTKYL